MSAAAPGGGGSVTVSSPSGDAAALLSLAADLDKHANDVTALGSTITRTTAGIREQANWTGTAADGYTGFCTAASSTVDALAAPLHAIAAAIKTYASHLSSAQQSVENAVNSANEAAESAAQSLQTAAENAASSAAGAANSAAEAAVETIDQAKETIDKIMETTEPVRKWIEAVHLPWDVGGGAAWELTVMKNLEAGKEKASDFVKDLGKLNDEWYQDVNKVALSADRGEASWEDVASAFASWTTKSDAAKAFGSQWLESAESVLGKFEWVGRGMGVLSLVGDAGTIWKPLDSGVLGDVDRGAAIVNAAAVTTSLVTSTAAGSSFVAGLAGANALDEVPIVGEVVMAADIGTGLYLGGDYVVHHWGTISNAVSGAAVHTADAVGHAAVSTVHAVGDAAGATVHALGSAVSSVESWF
jgi:uncharacterized protein YukE